MEILSHYIDGEATPDGNRLSDVYDPALGRVVRRVAMASPDTVRKAVGAAASAFVGWRKTQPQKRVRILWRFKDLLERHSDEIVSAITEEHGKVWEDAVGELQRGIEAVEYSCGITELSKGEHSRDVGPGIDCWSEFSPLGVVAGITPFNFPAMVPMWMFPIATACGNTFVLKPSEKDPSCSLILARLLTEAGLPKGVFNVINGDKETVNTLLSEPRVQAISFVGSTAVAEYIYATGARHGKRVQALGGAKNHAVVMPDADLENATNVIMGAAYGSCGERCMAISVVVVVGEHMADELVRRLASRVAGLRLGKGKGFDMGPLVTATHRDKVRGYCDIAEQEGARIVVDGRNPATVVPAGGFFLAGTLLDRVTPSMRVYREEIFGPVLCIMRVSTIDEAIELVDSHEYANGCCIFTRDGGSARRFSDNVGVGMIGINVPLPVPVASHSFGGWKRSFFGDLCAYGPDAVRFYTRRKTLTQRWPVAGSDKTQFAFLSNT
ncbi:MAG: CoA-acylating methylmalonate-semialdehyde dehydrogenase [Steroidobacteraceae bacterium]